MEKVRILLSGKTNLQYYEDAVNGTPLFEKFIAMCKALR